MAISQRQMTLAEFLELPEEKPALEYQDGWVRQKEMPKGPHGTLQSWLAFLINAFAVPTKLAWTFTETRVRLGGNALVPDLVVYRWGRIPRDADGEVADDFTTPPDLVIEILSPGQSLAEQEERCRWFIEHGVETVLLVNARTKSNRWIQLFQPGQAPTTLQDDDPIDLKSILPGFRLTVAELFGALKPGSRRRRWATASSARTLPNHGRPATARRAIDPAR